MDVQEYYDYMNNEAGITMTMDEAKQAIKDVGGASADKVTL